MQSQEKAAIASTLEGLARRLAAAASGSDPDVALALGGASQLHWMAAALRGRLRVGQCLGGGASADRLEAAARRVDDWVGEFHRQGYRARSRKGLWPEVAGIGTGAVLAELGELACAGDVEASVLEERLAGVVFLLSREEEFGNDLFRGHAQRDLLEIPLLEVSQVLRKIRASIMLAEAMDETSKEERHA